MGEGGEGEGEEADPYTGQGEYKEGLTTYEKIFKANSAKNKNMNIFIPF